MRFFWAPPESQLPMLEGDATLNSTSMGLGDATLREASASALGAQWEIGRATTAGGSSGEGIPEATGDGASRLAGGAPSGTARGVALGGTLSGVMEGKSFAGGEAMDVGAGLTTGCAGARCGAGVRLKSGSCIEWRRCGEYG